jgi:hypothetical protein
MFEINTPILDLPELETIEQGRFGGAIDHYNMPKLKRFKNNWSYHDLITSSTCESLELPSFTGYDYFNGHYDTCMIRCPKIKYVSLPALKNPYNNTSFTLIKSCPELLEVHMPSLTNKAWNLAVKCPNLRRLILGKIQEFRQGTKGGGNDNAEFATEFNLIHIEFGDGSSCNINLGNWNPKYALLTEDLVEETTADDGIVTTTTTLKNSLVDEEEDFACNLDKFLYNFREYIANRFADMTGKTALTLTLSQEVRDVLTPEIEEIIVTNKNWVISPAKTVTE